MSERGAKVWIVEDEAMIAALLADMLAELGFAVAGTAASFDEALAAADSVEADVALLDVNLGGREVYPIAERLAARRVPIVFSSGYGAGAAPDPWRSHPAIGKPAEMADLSAALNRALGR